MRWIGILSTAVALAFAIPAQAEDPTVDGDLMLTAVGYGITIPERSAFRLRMMDDTELNNHIARLVTAALRGRGYEVRDDAPFVITITTETAWSDPPAGSSLGEIDIGSGGFSVMVNLWSTTEESLLSDPPRHPVIDRDYHIRLSIYRADRHRYLWHGEVVDLREGQNPFIAGEPMVSALIGAMGKTVTARTIALGPDGR